MRTLLVSFFVFIGALLGTAFMYQNWVSGPEGISSYEAVRSSRSSKVQKLVAPSGKTLVPEGVIMGENDVDSISYVYYVNVEEGKQLDVTFTDVHFAKYGSVYDDQDGLILFDHSVEMIDETTAKVSVSVHLGMPSSEEQYNLLSGSNASFRVNFIQI